MFLDKLIYKIIIIAIFNMVVSFGYCLPIESNNAEFRGMWVITWEAFDPDFTQKQAQDRIINIMDNLVEGNFNNVLFQVRQGGTAYYQSSYELWGRYIGYRYPGFDPFHFAITEAHKRGIKLHAWVNTFEARYKIEGAPGFDNPSWLCRDGNGNPMPNKLTLSPGLVEVRNYLHKVLMEIVNNYDIDGLHLDYVRWPEFHTGNINSLVDNKIKQRPFDNRTHWDKIPLGDKYLFDEKHRYIDGVPNGYDSWGEWLRDSVTIFVKDLNILIKESKPWVKLSIAAVGKYNWGGWNGYFSCYQDSAKWFNKGYIDLLIGMHYHWYTPDGFQSILGGDCPNCWFDHILPGINRGSSFIVGPGSYLLEIKKLWNNHPLIVDTIRSFPWISGVSFFSYESWERQNYWKRAKDSFFK